MLDFSGFCNLNKRFIDIKLEKDQYGFSLKKTESSILNITLENYEKCIKYKNIKALIFKFFAPKTKTCCLKIFYGEISNRRRLYQLSEQRWQYVITPHFNENITYSTKELAEKYINILEKQEIEIRKNIKGIFKELGFDEERIIIGKEEQTQIF